MVRDRTTRPWGVWTRVALTLCLGAASAGACLLIVAARTTRVGLSHEREGMYALGNEGYAFTTIAWTVAKLPAVVALVGVAVLVAGVRRRSRMKALAAAAMLVGVNGSAQVLKMAFMRVYDPALVTLPSGHAALALSAACALVMITPAPWRPAGLIVAGALAALGATGVIAAYWHKPGDVLASLLLVGSWLTVVRVWTHPSRPGEGHDPGPGVGDEYGGSAGNAAPSARTAFTRDIVASACGAAWVIITFLGWGTSVNGFTLWRDAAAFFALVLVPLAAAALVALAARLPEGREQTH